MDSFNKFLISILLIFVFPFSCKKDKIEYNVNPDFEEYVQRFINEAAARGIEIDFSDTGLLLEYSDRIVDGASGFCYVGEHHIVIDKAEWTALTDTQKEFLIFHELGHCELDRRHKNEQFDNSLWKSLMRGDPLLGTQENIPVPYYGFRKAYYLNELFDENTSAPEWSTPNFSIGDISAAEKEVIIQRQDIPKISESPALTDTNYELAFEINGINNVPFLTELSWGAGAQKYFVRVYRNFGTYIGVLEEGKDHFLFFDPTKDNLDNIIVRQNNGFTQLFFDGDLVYHFDQLSVNLSGIKLEAKDGDGVLVSNFSIEEFILSRIL